MTHGETPRDTRMRPPVTHGQIFTFAEAVEVTGKSRSTLHRKREMLRQAGAHQDAAGVWSIPVSALVACGLLDTPDTRKSVSDTTVRPPNDTRVTPPHDTRMRPPSETPQNGEVEQLRRALAEAEKRAEVAEARAAERDRLIEAQSRTIALLEVRRPDSPEPAPQPAEELEPLAQSPAPPERASASPRGKLDGARRWWRSAGRKSGA